MAIPVENPPPPYAPAARSTGVPAREPFDAILAGAPPGARVYKAQVGWRGCLVALALAFGLLFAFGGLGTCAVSDAVLVELPRRLSVDLRTVAREEGRETVFDEDLRRFTDIVEGRRLGFLAAGVLLNRFSDCKADSTITTEELDHLMALVHDIVLGDGTIDPERYPAGR